VPLRVALRSADNNIDGRCERVVVGEINQHTDWSVAVKGVDCIVHMAGLVHVMNPSGDDNCRFHEVNVLGTERLALSAAALGVKRFVYLSSVKVNGEVTYGNPFTATDIVNPVDAYGLSKWHAEQKLFEIARNTGMEIVVIRPPLVYGPGVRANFLRLLTWVHKGIPLPLGAVSNARSLVSVWNLCDLIRCVVEAPFVTSGVLMASDDVDLSTPELIRRMAEPMGRAPRLIPVPMRLLKIAGIITGRSAEIERLCGSLTVNIAETKRQLNWTPLVSIDDGLARTVRWYLDEVGARVV
jgi:nucleoside-diphosphate-sugar epimerase